MAINSAVYKQIVEELSVSGASLVAVSKTKPVEEIQELYNLGQRDFGENYVQELVDKAAKLPNDIRWHFIGHLQTNKVKLIAPFVQLIHGVDSLKLLKEVNKEGAKNSRVIDCLLQIHIAQEETKFGLSQEELKELINQFTDESMMNIRIIGLMGMASFTNDILKIRNEFRMLKELFNSYTKLETPNASFEKLRIVTLSMGMSSDYRIAIEEGSNMVRIGSLLFGNR